MFSLGGGPTDEPKPHLLRIFVIVFDVYTTENQAQLPMIAMMTVPDNMQKNIHVTFPVLAPIILGLCRISWASNCGNKERPNQHFTFRTRAEESDLPRRAPCRAIFQR
jgi:hypothetical protein